MTPDAREAAADVSREVYRCYGQDWKMRLARYFRGPLWPGHTDRIAAVLLSLRAAGVDVGASIRKYERLDAALGVSVETPVTVEKEP